MQAINFSLFLFCCIFNNAWSEESGEAQLWPIVSAHAESNEQQDDPDTKYVAESDECGVPKARKERVVGGEDAYRGEFPWMVSIQKDGSHFCGGALIASQWVVSAAHCFNSQKTWELDNNNFVIGDYNLKAKEPEDSTVKLKAERIIVHKEFQPAEYINDIALIKLKEPIKLDKYKIPICLPTNGLKLKENMNVTVAGWGYTAEHGSKVSNVLQKVGLKLVTNDHCQGWYKEAGFGKIVKIHQTHLCAGYRVGKKDSCQGDSGGPIMKKEGKRYILIGLVSSGMGCARPLLPGLYTNVAAFTTWIEDQMK